MPQRTNTLTLGTDRALYVGEIPATGWHCHASPVLLMGLSGRFALRWGEGLMETCHSALVDAGVEHLFDPCGEVVALVYLEPDSPEARSLRSVFLQRGGVLLDVAAPEKLLFDASANRPDAAAPSRSASQSRRSAPPRVASSKR